MNEPLPLIYDLNLQELTSELKALNEPEFRAKQLWTAIYQNYRTSFDEITTLSKGLRQKLSEVLTFNALTPVDKIISSDQRTIKTLFTLHDACLIEAVLMLYDERRTLCISSQSGCSMGCLFCGTGQMGFSRNLTSGEIVAQVLHYARLLSENGKQVTNIVVMGMGEPFLNYANVMDALERLNDSQSFGLGARRFTISTVGIVPKIKQFADENKQYNLAISLHAVDDDIRSKLIPINKKFGVDAILNACRYYIKRTNRRVTFEYALIQDVNDSLDDAKALAGKLRGLNCHVNLIPLNPTPAYLAKPSHATRANSFKSVLDEHHIQCTVRMRRGIEIRAGCGQLAGQYGSKK
ncbi:MAG: 23S rRNA (adenine(2503)-C(2))-methyltransferase RlmN [Brevefilum sp.]|jgi:23S rRNA (adenine2503-C2)-methyltransferase